MLYFIYQPKESRIFILLYLLQSVTKRQAQQCLTVSRQSSYYSSIISEIRDKHEIHSFYLINSTYRAEGRCPHNDDLNTQLSARLLPMQKTIRDVRLIVKSAKCVMSVTHVCAACIDVWLASTVGCKFIMNFFPTRAINCFDSTLHY